MTERIHKHGLSIAPELYEFAENEALQYAQLTSDDFWSGVAHIFRALTPRNTELLATRAELQEKIDSWYHNHQIDDNIQAYKDFLIDIDYIEPEPEDFTISVTGIDEEIRTATGPQLVVPVLNARFALNAANARWGSLYDAFYGTDVISEDDGATRSGGYNPRRGAKVIDKAKSFLDKTFPLDLGSHHDVVEYRITDGQLRATLADGNHASLADASLFRGYQGEITNPTAILLRHNGLHVELQIDRNNPIGKDDPAGLKDILIESAITTIIDFEDSVAAVDAEDKVVGYRNWLGLNVGDLQETLDKNGKTIVRKLNPDRSYTTPDGSSLTLPGRSLLFVRNVGHLMTTDAIIDADGHEVYEGILDAIFTTLTALPGISPESEFKNSRTGSIYIVKPKMHGSAEVEFSIRIFQEVEKLFGLPEKTIKIGIMDEERRTSINLKAAIKAAQDRVAFINTGFLDRTGDEIHTSLHAGPVVRKAEMKNQPWYTTYEDYNVEQGLHTGFPHKAQIGKGMWAKPDLMADLVKEKINHPLAGATTAWVPSPTAATLHALHYHDVDVFSRQEEIKKADPVITDRLLEVPLHQGSLSQEDKNEELDNNAQSILGYVVRWVDQGIGCSKVPDIHDIALMEDRATLRISSQILANWLYHGVITEDDVISSLKKMAIKVDKQNENDPAYIPMAPNYDDSIAFQAAKELILHGATQPSGYTEPILHQKRKQVKALHR